MVSSGLEENLKKLADLRVKKGKIEKNIADLEKIIQIELAKYGIPFLKYVTTPTIWYNGTSSVQPFGNVVNYSITYQT